jgi:hypothetical protein
VPLATLVAVAGQRWTIEESFQAGKGLTGLDEHQVRRWTSWRRWTILAMLAHAFLPVTAATARAEPHPTPGLIALTANEIRHLFTSLLDRARRDIAHLLHWSRWRCTKPEPATATTAVKQPNSPDHELRLEY